MSSEAAVDTRSELDQISANLDACLKKQRQAFLADGMPTVAQRKDDLTKLEKMIVDNADAIVDAVVSDFGQRSRIETQMSELFQAVAAIRYARKRVKKWMKPRRGHVALTFKPGRSKVHYQPMGVVGIISPWNYPGSLTFIPLAAALAAGNRVMIKPSEITPNAAEIMRKLFAETFPAEKIAVFTGGPEVGQAFSSLAFDHLLFTGSTQLGRHIMRAAADNLTPVTLELGGKSPVIVHPDHPIDHAAQRIVAGKYFNAGQTCIAPDYVLVQKDQMDAFVSKIEETVHQFYPTIYDNDDYTAVVNQRHYDRLQSYLSDAREKGAKIIEITASGETRPEGSTKIPPTLILDGTDEMKAHKDEIFGPLLPIVPYNTIDDAIAYVNERPRPLALYYFDRNSSRINYLLSRTTSGGVTVNDTLYHVAQDDIPFGGVGDSGMGAYHGKDGFETFSHKKSVFYQSRFAQVKLLSPPYTALAHKVIALLIRRG